MDSSEDKISKKDQPVPIGWKYCWSHLVVIAVIPFLFGCLEPIISSNQRGTLELDLDFWIHYVYLVAGPFLCMWRNSWALMAGAYWGSSYLVCPYPWRPEWDPFSFGLRNGHDSAIGTVCG